VLTGSWKAVDLREVATLQRGYDLPYRSRKPGAVPIVTSSGVGDTHAEARVPGPGVVTGRYGTIGEVFFIQEDFWPLNTTLFVKDFHGNDPLFVSYLLRTIDFHSHSGKSGVPGVNRNDLHALTVRVPQSADEQRAIAGALGDVDTLLGALTRLIDKKRDLKQAAMPQLLTGQTRLPGFSGEWEVKRLSDLGTWKGGATPSMSNPTYWAGGDVPWASSGDIKTNVLTETAKAITRTAVNESSTTLLQPGGILIVTRSGILRRYLPVARNEIAVAINQDIKALIPDDALSSEFLLHALGHEGPRILASCLKAGTTVESIEYVWLKRFTLSLPTTTDEQIAIAAVLSDMDAELAALEQQLAKIRALKQGMMRELLTGRTRLV
jgi:type I restriction enzyme S subunit